MVLVKVPLTRFEIYLVLLTSLNLIITEVRGQNHDDPIVYPTAQTDPVYDIPARIMDEMNGIEDPDELFAKYFISNEPYPPDGRRMNVAGIGIVSRFGFPGQRSTTPDNVQLVQGQTSIDGEISEGNYVMRPHMPPCKPRESAVELKPPMAGVMVEPSCIMVPRCGPCCRFGMKCVPEDTETFVYSVQLAKYLPDSQRFKITERRNITEVHHKSCKCLCDVNPEDCQRIDKKFDGTSCKCVCKNERYNTFYCSVRGRQWNSDTCTCDCRELTCQEGYFFNNRTCRCDF